MRGDKMTIMQAVKIVESIINTDKQLIKKEAKGTDFAIFLTEQVRALETLLEYVKGRLN